MSWLWPLWRYHGLDLQTFYPPPINNYYYIFLKYCRLPTHGKFRTYKRPRTFLQTADLDALLNTNANAIIAADLNSKHTSWYSNILSHYQNSRADLTISAPTIRIILITARTCYTISFLKTDQLNFHMENYPRKLFSDHTPIILEFIHQAAIISSHIPSHSIDWEKFESAIIKTLHFLRLTSTHIKRSTTRLLTCLNSSWTI